jgi:predicted DNA binding CopG/RHH family protein
MRKVKKKVIPKFKSEGRERAFWASHDSSDYLDWTKAQRALLPNLKPSLRTISLRLPEALIARLKVLANKRDVPYQSLLKVLLAERLKQEEATQAPTLSPTQSLH